MSIQTWNFQFNWFLPLDLPFKAVYTAQHPKMTEMLQSVGFRYFMLIPEFLTMKMLFTLSLKYKLNYFSFFFKQDCRVLPKYQNRVLLSVYKRINTNGKLQLPISVETRLSLCLWFKLFSQWQLEGFIFCILKNNILMLWSIAL